MLHVDLDDNELRTLRTATNLLVENQNTPARLRLTDKIARLSAGRNPFEKSELHLLGVGMQFVLETNDTPEFQALAEKIASAFQECFDGRDIADPAVGITHLQYYGSYVVFFDSAQTRKMGRVTETNVDGVEGLLRIGEAHEGITRRIEEVRLAEHWEVHAWEINGRLN